MYTPTHGCSLLYLAAAKGHADAVKKLLTADVEVGFVRNTDGRTPLHVAAIKERASVLAELVRANPELNWALTDRDEMGLYLCVKWNRFEALKLSEEMGKYGDIVNWKDCEGNTAFHIAVTNKHIQHQLFANVEWTGSECTE